MIFDFLKKQKDIAKQKDLIIIMIQSINISEEQKNLYLESLEILDEPGVKKLYIDLQVFVENIEIKELAEINKENFTNIAGMRKKEAEDKTKEMNSFSFLLHNL